jgi:phosphoribosylformylglycinamidine synthase PurS subunit
LRSMSIEGVHAVRQGKIFDIEIDGEDHKRARATLGEACERLLANTIVENYAIEIAKTP